MAAKRPPPTQGKWAALLPPETPLLEAGQTVLAARLEKVYEHLQPAAEQAHQNVEYVHQLRVATRRAGAALRAFRDLLHGKDARKVKALLRCIRRAAGDARDWDVFAGILDESAAFSNSTAEPTKDYLLGYANGHRAVAQLFLTQIARERHEQLAESVDELPGGLTETDDARTLGAHATKAVTELFATFNEKLASGPKTIEELHQLRIQAKRTRYAMEIFAGCFAPPFREEIYPAVEELQSVLGTIQDGHVLKERLGDVRFWLRSTRPDVLQRLRPGLDGLTKESNSQVRTARVTLRRWARQWATLNEQHPLAEIGL